MTYYSINGYAGSNFHMADHIKAISSHEVGEHTRKKTKTNKYRKLKTCVINLGEMKFNCIIKSLDFHSI